MNRVRGRWIRLVVLGRLWLLSVLCLDVVLDVVLVDRSIPSSPQQRSLIHLLAVPTPDPLVPSPHTHITPDTDTATLLSYNPRQSSRLGKSGELLRRENGEGLGLDIQAMSAEFTWLQWVLGLVE